MCVIFFYVNSNPAPGGFKLILASNRDEFYARETRSVTKWKLPNKQVEVYGGIDLEPGREGGTWLAIGANEGILKIGALLNLTGEPKSKNGTAGRGMIVSDFVTSTRKHTINDYNGALVADCTKYNAFNFISIEIGTPKQPARISLCSNVPPTVVDYEEGKCYGFGNSLPAVPFQKVIYGQQYFQQIVKEFHADDQTTKGNITPQQREKKTKELIEQLQQLLKCEQKCWPDAELQRRAPNWGEQLSAINVCMPLEGYGSRTHSVILVDDKNEMHFYEETMKGSDPNGDWLKTHLVQQQFFNTDN